MALGSVLGTIEEVVDEMRDVGVRVGALGIKSFRPFPLEEVREALSGACRVVVLEKALAAGRGGIVSTDVHEAMVGGHARCSTVIAGLGGRAITRESLHRLLEQAGPRRARAAQLPRPRHRIGPARARPASATASPLARTPRTCSATSAWSRRRPTDALPGRQALPDGHLRGRRSPARSGEAPVAGADGALQHADLRAPRLPGMRRGPRRPVTRSTPPCGPRRAS